MVIILLLNAQVYHFGQSNKQLHRWNWSENATFSGGISMTTLKGSMVYSVGVLYSVGFFVCVICFGLCFCLFSCCAVMWGFFSCLFVCLLNLPSYSVLCKWLYSFPSEQGIRWEAEAFLAQCIKTLVLQNQNVRGLLLCTGSCLGLGYKILLTSQSQASCTKL